MTYSHFRLGRLRVLRKGAAVYDQTFHPGVNIIRGENGSGKSTIADFIFYILGGEFDNWKTIASRCDQVQAEVITRGGALTLRRDIARAQTPMNVYFGRMEEAEKSGLDGWENYPIRRQESRESFSQILFRAAGIPEAQSQGAANITMNQLLRLLYSDQRTPASFLFRYENFDTREIREAVGDLVCGLSVYELYEIELRLRDLDKEFDDKARRLSALLQALPGEEALTRVEAIDQRVADLNAEYTRVTTEIADADNRVDEGESREFLKARAKSVDELRKYREKIAGTEQALQVSDLESGDLVGFLKYLEELSEKLPKAEKAAEIVGNIEFTHCPACLSPLSPEKGAGHCVLCGAETDPEAERSRYLQIKMDIDVQIRESRQPLDDKRQDSAQLERDLRRSRRFYEDMLSDFTVKYDVSTSPRESFVAERYQRLGQIDRDRSTLERLRERVMEIEELAQQKERLQNHITRLKDRQAALETQSRRRRAEALARVSEKAKAILRQDLERQPEFRTAQNVAVNFSDNSVLVDGELNFAESSNVIVKNTAILSLLLAALEDEKFYHPRFILLDNIEDKGMEQSRSHNFQEIVVRASEQAHIEHQIIFTTSMMNPELDEEGYVIGPHYTHENRTLEVESI
jgi:AAA domain